jgi:hypothetical protein
LISQATKAADSNMPRAARPATSPLVQPATLPRSSAQTSANAAAATMTRPTRSSFAAAPKLSWKRAMTIAIAIRPIGMLIQKIHFQPKACVIAPPADGPAISAKPTTPLKMPSAFARSSDEVDAPSSAIASGMIKAAPTPCATRPAIRRPIVGANAQAIEDSMKMAMPARNIRRRPSRSPSAAPVSSSAAKLRLYPLVIHCRVSSEAAKSRRIETSAVVTTSASRATMKATSEVPPSTHCFEVLPMSCIAVSPGRNIRRTLSTNGSSARIRLKIYFSGPNPFDGADRLCQ